MTKSQKTPPLTDAELEKWLFCNLGGDSHASGLITLCLSSSNPARVTNGAIVIHTQRLKSDPGGNLLS
ncbi:hypothetical protein ACQ7NR_21330 [Escherichia coli]|uniref:hypothetical protein n=1 Tax=Escherichia coli TaxID=562 RepID=UPI0023592A60|nr:hypothetical protein [Escherichia coli]MDC9136884.1 hypothetical protein [Escherichia coli]MDN1922845.1 hypothetical protein [Escherichia coli]